MATTNDNGLTEELIKVEQERIEQKKQLTGDPNWTPAGGIHGSGVIPEEEWKKINPESKNETALNFKQEGGDK